MTFRLVHPSSDEHDPMDREYLVYDGEADWSPTCKGPGPTRREFINEAGNRDVITVEQCPRCNGNGGSHREYTVITLEQQRESA